MESRAPTKRSFWEDELDKPTVFRDENTFSLDYLPNLDGFVHRERELRTLARFYGGCLSNPGKFRQNGLIEGPVGAGKTSLSRIFGREFEVMGRKQGVNAEFINVNCRKNRSPFLVLVTVMKQLISYFPTRGFGPEELIRLLSTTLKQLDLVLLLCLDEVDHLRQNGGVDLLYSLSRLGEDENKETSQRLSLLVVTKNPLFRQYLDPSTNSSLSRNVVRLGKYSKHQLEDILGKRSQKGLQPGSISSGTIEMIAEAAEESGDARFTIELLWRAGKLADAVESSEILPEHVREAKSSVNPFSRDLLRDLSQNHRTVLLSLARALKIPNRESHFVDISELKQVYESTCHEMSIESRKHTMLWTYLQDLASLGIINTHVSSKKTQGRTRGRTTQISLTDIPAVQLEEEILILERQGPRE